MQLAPSAGPISHDRMVSQFAKMTRPLSAMVEQNGRMELMYRKSVLHSLDFDSPKRKRAAPFSPVKRALEKIAAIQEEDDFDYERDSVRSKSSLSTRIRLQEKFRVIDQKPADSTTPASIKNWIRKHAANITAIR